MPENSSRPFGPGVSLLSTGQFDRAGLDALFDLAHGMRPIATGRSACHVLDGAVLCSLFFEPSTRTRLSFEAAFERLGGSLISTTGFTFSSMAKGESISDTSRVVSGYSDVIVVRHPDEGSVAEFDAASVVPVINAGDGAGEHPSQALLDVFTLREELQARGRSIDGATIALLGDLKYGRTAHSLLDLLRLFPTASIRLFAPPSLEMPAEHIEAARRQGRTVVECDSAAEALDGVDALYTTRVQRERMTVELPRSGDTGGDLVNRRLLEQAGAQDALIMHPLPRDAREDSFDLSPDVDDLPGLSIFHQTDNGLLVRMAIYATVFGLDAELIERHTRPTPWKGYARA